MGIAAKDSTVRVTWTASVSLGPDGYHKLFGAPAWEEIDYDAPLVARKIRSWPPGRPRGGLGHGAFGHFAFGHGAAGVGFGHFRFGHGPFGRGAPAMSTEAEGLDDGLWKMAVAAYDRVGNRHTASPPVELAGIAVMGTPRPPGVPVADAYAAGSDTLTLSFALSADDEG